RRFFQRLIGVTGVGPKLAVSLVSALGVERGARAVQERNIALLASVSGIGKKTAERLALELADKVAEFVDAAAAPVSGAASAALQALERLGYARAEADRALGAVLAADGGGAGDAETLVRRALQLLTQTFRWRARPSGTAPGAARRTGGSFRTGRPGRWTSAYTAQRGTKSRPTRG